MTIVRHFFFFFLFLSILVLSNGCATLPYVSEMIDEAPTAQEPPQIVSSKGLLSPKKSKAIMERLKNSVNPTDILERHTAVVESVTESPLTKGNKVTLLADGRGVDLPPKDSVLRYVEDGPALGVTEDFDEIRRAEYEEIERVRQPTTSRTTDGHCPRNGERG